MQQVDTARPVVVVVAGMVDLRLARLPAAAGMVDRQVVTAALPVEADMVALPADRRQVDTADLRKRRPPADTAAADLVSPPAVMAEDSAAAGSVRQAADSRPPEDPWVRAWATTSTRPCR
jgi:hypothetical protein